MSEEETTKINSSRIYSFVLVLLTIFIIVGGAGVVQAYGEFTLEDSGTSYIVTNNMSDNPLTNYTELPYQMTLPYSGNSALVVLKIDLNLNGSFDTYERVLSQYDSVTRLNSQGTGSTYNSICLNKTILHNDSYIIALEFYRNTTNLTVNTIVDVKDKWIFVKGSPAIKYYGSIFNKNGTNDGGEGLSYFRPEFIVPIKDTDYYWHYGSKSYPINQSKFNNDNVGHTLDGTKNIGQENVRWEGIGSNESNVSLIFYHLGGASKNEWAHIGIDGKRIKNDTFEPDYSFGSLLLKDDTSSTQGTIQFYFGTTVGNGKSDFANNTNVSADYSGFLIALRFNETLDALSQIMQTRSVTVCGGDTTSCYPDGNDYYYGYVEGDGRASSADIPYRTMSVAQYRWRLSRMEYIKQNPIEITDLFSRVYWLIENQNQFGVWNDAYGHNGWNFTSMDSGWGGIRTLLFAYDITDNPTYLNYANNYSIYLNGWNFLHNGGKWFRHSTDFNFDGNRSVLNTHLINLDLMTLLYDRTGNSSYLAFLGNGTIPLKNQTGYSYLDNWKTPLNGLYYSYLWNDNPNSYSSVNMQNDAESTYPPFDFFSFSRISRYDSTIKTWWINYSYDLYTRQASIGAPDNYFGRSLYAGDYNFDPKVPNTFFIDGELADTLYSPLCLEGLCPENNLGYGIFNKTYISNIDINTSVGYKTKYSVTVISRTIGKNITFINMPNGYDYYDMVLHKRTVNNSFNTVNVSIPINSNVSVYKISNFSKSRYKVNFSDNSIVYYHESGEELDTYTMTIDVFNLSNSKRLDFNEGQNASFLGLSNALIYNTNGSTYGNYDVNQNDGDISITLPSNNQSYLLNNFNLTEGVARLYSPLWFSQSTSTTKHIASNLSTTVNVSVIFDVTDCDTIDTITYTSDDGTATYTYSKAQLSSACSANKVTLTVPIDPAVASNVFDITYQYDHPELASYCTLMIGGFGDFGELLALVAIAVTMVFIISAVNGRQMNIKEFLVPSIIAVVFVAIIASVGGILVDAVC